MSQWTTRIVDHAVWAQMPALGSAIDQAVSREGSDIAAIEGLERLRVVLAFIGKRLASGDPFLKGTVTLDALNSALVGANSELQQYIASGNVANIVNANTHADVAIAQAAQLFAVASSDDLTTLNESAASYRLALEKMLSQTRDSSINLKNELEALRIKVGEIQNTVTAERDRLSAVSAEYQGQFSTAQEARNQEYTKAQADRQERFAAIVADYTQRLTEKGAEFSQKLIDKSNDFDVQRETIRAAHLDALKVIKERYEQDAEAMLTAISDHKSQVEKLVGVIGNLGVTSGYLKAANHARKTMWVWQIITVSSFLGIIYIAYTLFLPMNGFTWEGLASRVFVSITVGILAAYAASQADKFLENERRNRKLALEFEALGPYLAPLPDEMQYKFRIDIGDRSFGHADPALGRGKDKSPATLLDVLPKSKDAREFALEVLRILRS